MSSKEAQSLRPSTILFQRLPQLLINGLKGQTIQINTLHSPLEGALFVQVFQRGLKILNQAHNTTSPNKDAFYKHSTEVVYSNVTPLINPLSNWKLRQYLTQCNNPLGDHLLGSMDPKTLEWESWWVRGKQLIKEGSSTLVKGLEKEIETLLFLRLYLNPRLGDISKDKTNSKLFNEEQWLAIKNKNLWLLQPKFLREDQLMVLLKHEIEIVRLTELRHQAKLLVRSQNIKEGNSIARKVGQGLGLSIKIVIDEHRNKGDKVIMAMNIKFLGEFASLIPLGWFTDQLLNSLLFLLKENDPTKDSILVLLSYWIRRQQASLSQDNSIEKSDPMLDRLMETMKSLTTRDEKELTSSLIILTQLPDAGEQLQKTLMTALSLPKDIKEEGETSSLPTLDDLVQVGYAKCIQQAHQIRFDDELIPQYINYQTRASQSNLAMGEAELKLLKLHRYLVMEQSEFAENPYLWHRVLSLPLSCNKGLWVAGGSWLGLEDLINFPDKKSLSPKTKTLANELKQIFLDYIQPIISKFVASTVSCFNDEELAIAHVLGRSFDRNFKQQQQTNSLTSGGLLIDSLDLSEVRSFMLKLFPQLLLPDQKKSSENALLSRELGPIAQLLGWCLTSHHQMIQYTNLNFLGVFFSSNNHNSRANMQQEKDTNKSGLTQLLELSQKIHHTFTSQPLDEEVQQLNIRSIQFPIVTLLNQVFNQPDMSLDDQVVQLGILILYNIHFIDLSLVHPVTKDRQGYRPYNDLVGKLFDWILNQNPSLIPSTQSLIKVKNEAAEGANNLSQRSKVLFNLWFMERCVIPSTLKDRDANKEGLLDELLPTLQPSLFLTDIDSSLLLRDQFESAHAILLSYYRTLKTTTNIENDKGETKKHDPLFKTSIGYRNLLLQQHRQKLINVQQFQLAYTTLTQSLSQIAYQTTSIRYERLLWNEFISYLIQSTSPNDPTTPGYLTTSLELLPYVPITYLPSYLQQIETKVNEILSHKDKNGEGQRKIMGRLFDVVGSEKIPLTHRELTIPWYLELRKSPIFNQDELLVPSIGRDGLSQSAIL